MFLTCGRVAGASSSMDYSGDFQAGYQEIDGIALGYLQVDGTRMFALPQVFSHLFGDLPRAAVSKAMETLRIQSRRCDPGELRTLKAIQSVPMRAVQCSLISRSDLEALHTSCRALDRRKRRRRKRRQPGGEIFQLASSYGSSDSVYKRDTILGGPFSRVYEPPKGYNRSCLLGSYPGDLQLLHSAVGGHDPQPGKQRSACGCLSKEKGGSPGGSKRQSTSAGSSSDSDSSSSSESSEEEEEDEEEEEEDSSSSSSSASDSSGDSVQSTRYRQAALPRLPAPTAASPALPGGSKALRPDGSLLLWARTLRASALVEEEEEEEEEEETRIPSALPGSPDGHRQPKKGASCVKAHRELSRDPQLSKDSPIPDDDPGLGEPVKAGSVSPDGGSVAPDGGSTDPSRGSTPPEGTGREAHFDRLIRQSKLWCYAKGFNVDGGKALRRVDPAPKPLKGDLERNPKRCPTKGRPPKVPRKATKKGSSPPGSTPPARRSSFTLMGTFPCTPSLVVGSDGDLCPAASLCVRDSCALSKTHPLWTWQLGGNAIPVPPSLKFRGYTLEDF